MESDVCDCGREGGKGVKQKKLMQSGRHVDVVVVVVP